MVPEVTIGGVMVLGEIESGTVTCMRDKSEVKGGTSVVRTV